MRDGFDILIKEAGKPMLKKKLLKKKVKRQFDPECDGFVSMAALNVKSEEHRVMSKYAKKQEKEKLKRSKISQKRVKYIKKTVSRWSKPVKTKSKLGL